MQSKFLLFSLLVLVFNFSAATALRCYTCNDCDEQSLATELEVCSVWPETDVPNNVNSNPSGNPTPAASPAATVPASASGATTAASANAPASGAANAGNTGASAPAAAVPSPAAATGTSDDDEDYDSDEDESAPSSTLGIMPVANNVLGAGAAAVAGSAASAGAAATAGAAGAAAANSDSEDEDDDDDYDEKRRRIAPRQVIQTERAVCYIASLKLNGTEITNRGCTILKDDNRTAACTSLFQNWEVVGCRLCETHGCNAPQPNRAGYCRTQTTLAMTVMAIALYFAALC